MNHTEPHSDVGATGYAFCAPFPCRLGRTRNIRMFHIHWGDSPHQTYGEILMPGAFRVGIVAGVLSEDGMQPAPDTPGPNCELHTSTKGVLARAYIPAASPEELAVICQMIGGLQPIPARPLTRGERFMLGFRFLWIRRPRLRIVFRDTP